MLTITPYLIVEEGQKALAYYEKAFGAEILESHLSPEGKVLNARIKLGNGEFMLSDECPDDSCSKGLISAKKQKATSCFIHLYVEDVDAFVKRALKEGGKIIMPVEDMFWGDRYGQIEDPFHHRWSIATPKAR